MRDKPKLSIGLIGTGFMGKAHAVGFSAAQRVFDLPMQINLHTVADVTDETARRAADDLGVATWTSNWHETLDGP